MGIRTEDFAIRRGILSVDKFHCPHFWYQKILSSRIMHKLASESSALLEVNRSVAGVASVRLTSHDGMHGMHGNPNIL
jgi:hypothetical protein